ncbi:hypothetical protein MPTK1_4g20200 [Marchantia polymorpha subsp. ruderalis]|uniref:Uncharacterized protein n=2 Tax=Marchantia polymorpha TaxID=3197 RepID=A0AAF6BBW3_MARPO|nr:hypothetical protein MARPO_0116s0022 [Marchantia polymorpha]BBN09497.1 hypothetical protein Mp_4g20200 [Marchantia polymorpha subsp. ruderalis]|eukprot:PTQ31033.1 hypothetical protein MARPO_0116s0022 [Marchantia polymorpha]
MDSSSWTWKIYHLYHGNDRAHGVDLWGAFMSLAPILSRLAAASGRGFADLGIEVHGTVSVANEKAADSITPPRGSLLSTSSSGGG